MGKNDYNYKQKEQKITEVKEEVEVKIEEVKEEVKEVEMKREEKKTEVVKKKGVVQLVAKNYIIVEIDEQGIRIPKIKNKEYSIGEIIEF